MQFSFILSANPVLSRPNHHCQTFLSSSRSTSRATASVPNSHSSSSLPTAPFDFDHFHSFIYQAQHALCEEIEEIDGTLEKFSVDDWSHSNGKGRTCVLQGGKVYEKAGVNVSVVQGILSTERANAMASRGRSVTEGTTYQAAALSLVLHAQSPFIPTLRADVRIFSTTNDDDSNSINVWGGGGADLTMCYIDRPTFIKFHCHWREICESNGIRYDSLKKQCDEYFYLPSRGEYRGIGGIFYDDLTNDSNNILQFQQTVLNNILPSYLHVFESNGDRSWNEHEKKWQKIRRGRYLEFNLLNDRGIRFGLAGAPTSRTDAIMISAPPSIEYPYNFVPKHGSREKQTLDLLSNDPIDWAYESSE